MSNEISLPMVLDDSAMLSKIDDLTRSIRMATKESEQFTSATKQGGIEAAKAAGKATNETEKATQSIKKQTKEKSKNTKETKENNKELVEQIKNYEVFGVSINGITASLGKATSALMAMAGATQGGAVALKVFRAALISTGIGAIVVALGSLIAYLTQTQKGIELVSNVMSALGTAVGVVIERLLSFGSGLVELFKGNISSGLSQMKDSFSGIGSEIAVASANAFRLRNELQQLDKQQADLEVRRAQERADIEALKKQSEDRTLSEKERVAFAQEAYDREKALLDEQIGAAERRVEILKEQNAINEATTTEEDLQRVRDAEIELAELREDSLGRQTGLQNALNGIREEEEAIRQQAHEKEMKRIAEREAAEQAYADALSKVQQRIEDERIKKLGGADRIQAERDKALAQLDALEDELKEQAKAAGKAYDESFVEALRAGVRREAEQELTEFYKNENEERIKDFLNAINERLKVRRAEIDLEEKIEMERISLIRESGDEALTLEQFQQQQRLLAQRKFLQQRAQLIAAEFGSDSKEVELVKLQIQTINAELAKLADSDQPELYDVGQKFDEFIANSLKLDGDQIEQFKNAFRSMYADISSIIQGNTQLQIEENQRYLDSLEERRSKAESLLNEELEKQREGAANSVETRRKELQQIEAEQRAAEQRQQELREKAKRRELAAQAAEQAASITTTAFNLYKNFTKIPLGLGIPLAAALVAKLFATFKNIRAQAEAIGSESLSEGGPVTQLLNGRSDKQGQRGHRVEGSNLRLGGDEFVIRSEISQKERKFLEAFNRNGWAGISASMIPDAIGGRIVQMGINNDDRIIKDAIERQTSKLIEQAENDPKYIPAPFGYIEKTKRKTKRVHING